MYENFVLKNEGEYQICGYHWKKGNPLAVVCIIHGIGEYAGRYNRIADRLMAENIALLSMDLRGHGRTSGPRGHCAPRDKILADIGHLIQYAGKEYPGKDIILYGHSMGGNLTLDFRCRGELNELPAAYLISSPWISLVRPVSGLQYALIGLLSKLIPSFGINSAVEEEVLGNPECVRPYKEDRFVHSKISARCVLDGYDTGLLLKKGELRPKAGVCEIPTLMMIGSEDKICDPRGSRDMYKGMKERGENVELIDWPGLCHEIHNGGADSRGDEVINVIRDFAVSRRLPL